MIKLSMITKIDKSKSAIKLIRKSFFKPKRGRYFFLEVHTLSARVFINETKWKIYKQKADKIYPGIKI